MSESEQRAKLCEIAVKAALVDDGTETIVLTEEEWETSAVPTLNWRLYHVDDEPELIDEPKNYPAIELSFSDPRRLHPHDPMLLEAVGQILCLTHYSRDRKRQVLSELEGIVRGRIEDRGNWSKIDLALPDDIGLCGLQLIPADPELNENIQAQAWRIVLHLVTTNTDTAIATTTL